MGLKISDCTFIGNKVGVSAGHDADISVEGTRFEGNGTAILLRDPRPICDYLGISRDVNVQELRALLQEFATKKATPDEVKAEIASGRMKGWLAVGADVVQVAQGIAQAVATPSFIKAAGLIFGGW